MERQAAAKQNDSSQATEPATQTKIRTVSPGPVPTCAICGKPLRKNDEGEPPDTFLCQCDKQASA